MDNKQEAKKFVRYKNFGEVSIDYFISRIMADVEEFIFNDGKTSIDSYTKEQIIDWMDWLSEDEWEIISDGEREFIKNAIEESLGAMPIWKNDKALQQEVINGFTRYFGVESPYYLMFKNAYIKGLKEEGYD